MPTDTDFDTDFFALSSENSTDNASEPVDCHELVSCHKQKPVAVDTCMQRRRGCDALLVKVEADEKTVSY